VRFDAWADSTFKNPGMRMELSGDGGNSWTSVNSPTYLAITPAEYYQGGSQDTWGRSWAVSDFSHSYFRVRITNVAEVKVRSFYLDFVAVDVYYAQYTSAGDAVGVKLLAVPIQIPRNADFKSLLKSPLIAKVSSASAQSTVSSVTISYDYDPLNRLTNASYSTGDTYTYTYDSFGNRKTKEVCLAGLDCLTTTYEYDSANRLTFAQTDQLSPID
jgi:YD repeat-containing protein